MLGIAYACSLGGMATLVGTPPNLSFARIFEITFPNAEPIAFGQWLVMAFPITVVLLTIVWLLLTRVFFRFGESFEVDRDVVKREYAALGSISYEERAVLAVFAATAFGWVFRKDLVLGILTVPGWSRLLDCCPTRT
jgi:sodium-dependent dicarboxylate transporter 2/3/5